jgi:peptidoglycan/LPS O-acetylase OafA/YrhL
MSPAKPDNSRLLMLDLMRGIAAIAVLIYHDGGFLGVGLLPNAYLAVDLFFLLSGFVIAHNYDRKIAAGMSLIEFMVQRIIRLYPCMVLALAVGVVVFALRMVRHQGYFDGWSLLTATGLNALFLPAVNRPYGLEGYFPFVSTAWSLTLEVFANIVFWLLFPLLNRLRLNLLILASGAAMVAGVFIIGTIDVGMRMTDFWWGVPRVMLTFFLGVALRRHYFERVSLDLGGRGGLLVFLSLMLVFNASELFGKALMPVTDLLAAVVVFPLLLLVVVRATPGAGTAAICKWTGDASYPVYLLQTPLMGVVAAVPQLFGMMAADFVPWIGLAHVGATILIGLWVDRYYELPLRRWLKDQWLRFKGTPPVARRADSN